MLLPLCDNLFIFIQRLRFNFWHWRFINSFTCLLTLVQYSTGIMFAWSVTLRLSCSFLHKSVTTCFLLFYYSTSYGNKHDCQIRTGGRLIGVVYVLLCLARSTGRFAGFISYIRVRVVSVSIFTSSALLLRSTLVTCCCNQVIVQTGLIVVTAFDQLIYPLLGTDSWLTYNKPTVVITPVFRFFKGHVF